MRVIYFLSAYLMAAAVALPANTDGSEVLARRGKWEELAKDFLRIAQGQEVRPLTEEEKAANEKARKEEIAKGDKFRDALKDLGVSGNDKVIGATLGKLLGQANPVK
ncbi:hypothetical protein BDV38DRAFT_287326 [Aspergillus pseudotamarii]|uniref:Uncharacterized protein n=1 Tax=Aspergillus pseudotamarii TaxID=132259 RepID=A0A5N6SGQ5_ASPPS|nr:uncharacterized protein BDV38DRAFT_287326 [Aspergillus pseudotamarii]KAE8132851.1 hypothetical protein BDV38DRAFT_287326 [Aspergillus pseudotamarii]